MPNFFETSISASEANALTRKLIQRSIAVNNCCLWQARTDRQGYGILRLTYQGHIMSLKAHRLAFYLANDCQPFNVDLHVSHMCHTKKCIEVSHLSLEPALINNRRKSCQLQGICCGHEGYHDCIFPHWYNIVFL